MATSPEQLEGLLADENMLRAAGKGTQLFAFDHRWPLPRGVSSVQVNAVLYAPLGAPCSAPLLTKLREATMKLDGAEGT